MVTMREAARDFLGQKNIAVVGVSRDPKKTANYIYKKLRSLGYSLFPVNPNTSNVEGDICYRDLKSIPAKLDGVFIITKPEATENVVKECAELGIKRVWMHKGIDQKAGSVSNEAVDFCHKHGITVIPGGCPMMYCRHADFGHRFFRWLYDIGNKLPKEV
ncbi:MAG TPA: CoA-binding protein [Chitinophagaceae bacterium]|nr:CoA-binding protein [Chitinophagaceae bacterium]